MVSQAHGLGETRLQAYHRGVIIAVDIGNSAAKAALVDGASVRESGRLDTAVGSGTDLAEGLGVLAGSMDPAPSTIVAVSVVDRWTERLERAADQLGLSLTVVAASHVPIGTALLRPDQTGPDRLVAAWAAAVIHGTPAIVVDLGTATTVDAIDGDGFFLGGAILPGLGLAADALADGTARLPRITLGLPTDAIGRDTTTAMQSGVVVGHIGAVRELSQRMQARMRPSPDAPSARIIVTGGHANADWARRAWLEPGGAHLPPVADELDPDLILKGLGLLAEQLVGKPPERSGA
jgi:type III pantothenate kinase